MEMRPCESIFCICSRRFRFICRSRILRHRYLVLAITTFLILYALIHSYSRKNTNEVLTGSEYDPASQNSISGVQIQADSDGFKQCHIPNLNTFDKTALSYMKTLDPLMCRSHPQILYRDEHNQWRFNYTHILHLEIDVPTCHYQSVHRGSDDVTVEFGPRVPFKPPFKIPSEIFTIMCQDNEFRTVLQKSFAQIVPQLGKSHKSSVDNYKYNVIIFGVDSYARLNAIRKIPKAYSYLTKDMAGYDFKGFTKVGDNTYPNVVAMLAGEDIKSPINNFEKEYQDNIPLLWQEYGLSGYTTLYAEDWSEICAFNNLKKGFLKAPTDHYLRPLYLAKRLVKPVSISRVRLKSADPTSQFDGFYYRNTFNNASAFCHGDTPDHMDVMNYLKDFITSYKSNPIFGFSWLTRLAHEDLNEAQLVDEDLVEFFSFLKMNNYTKSSFIFFVSDHGILEGSFTQTYNGYYETRMPILIVIPPDDFAAKYPVANANLMKNANEYRLTSPYDIYHTLYDISQGQFYQSSATVKPPKFGRWPRAGRSLFTQVPVNRKCADAGIREHHCACYEITPVNKSDIVVKRIAEFLVSEVNKITEPFRDKCVVLHHAEIIAAYRRGTLHRTTDTSLQFMPDDITSHTEIVVAVRVSPSNAIFEDTVSYHKATGTLELMGGISRTNRYGNQSRCMTDYTLRFYCYCRIQQ